MDFDDDIYGFASFGALLDFDLDDNTNCH